MDLFAEILDGNARGWARFLYVGICVELVLSCASERKRARKDTQTHSTLDTSGNFSSQAYVDSPSHTHRAAIGTGPIAELGFLGNLYKVDSLFGGQRCDQLDIILMIAVLSQNHKLGLAALQRLANLLDAFGYPVVVPGVVEHLDARSPSRLQ